MYLCSCSCRRAGSDRRASTRTASAARARRAPARTARRRSAPARSMARDHVARRTRSRRDPAMTNFTSSCGDSASRLLQSFLSDFAARRALDVDDLDDRRRHGGDRPMAAGLEQHRAAAVEQALHQRIDVVLEQRLAAGDLDEPAAVAARPRRRPRRATACGPRETRTACRTTSSAGRRRSAARTRTAARRASTRPESSGRSR